MNRLTATISLLGLSIFLGTVGVGYVRKLLTALGIILKH